MISIYSFPFRGRGPFPFRGGGPSPFRGGGPFPFRGGVYQLAFLTPGILPCRAISRKITLEIPK